jgi:hypothetical protein
MNAQPPFPLNPAIGEIYRQWTWNGARWVCSGGGPIITTTVFTTPGPGLVYMPRAGLVTVTVEVIGGGGGGGGAQGQLDYPATASGWMLSGGGGASGGYSRSTIGAALVRGGVIVTVGAGGLAGPPTGNTPAGNGGMSSFGALVTASGGNGGGSNVYPTIGGGAGGPRAPLGTGDLAVYGNGGEHGQSIEYSMGVGQVILFGGRGGGSFLQSAEVGAEQSPTGGVGGAGYFGAGGGGAASPYVTGPVSGGPGGAGVVICTEYCFGVDFDDCDCPPQGAARVARGSVPAEFDPYAYSER